MRSRILDKLISGLSLFLVVLLVNCGSAPTGGHYKDGRIIVRNSTGDEEGWIYARYEKYPQDSRRVKLTLRVRVEEEVTYVGSLESKDVTRETGPLWGGTRIRVDVVEGGGEQWEPKVADITVLVDGNVYIEAYSQEWKYWYAHQIKLRQVGAFPFE